MEGDAAATTTTTSPNKTSPGGALLNKLRNMASTNRVTASGDAKSSPGRGSLGGSTGSGAETTATTAGTNKTPASAPAAIRAPTASAAAAAAPATAAAAAGRPQKPQQPAAQQQQRAAAAPATARASSGSGSGDAWTQYRETRLAKAAKWVYLLLVSLFFVSLYCGDITPASMKSTAVLPRITEKMAQVAEAASPYFQLPAGVRDILDKVPSVTSTWNGLSNKMPPQVSLLTPRQSPALPRGSVLRAGDYIYSCLPTAEAKKDKKNKDAASSESPCVPTYFHLRDDGALVLARGTTPSRPSRVLWQSKPGNAKQGKYTLTYNAKGRLIIALEGKEVWAKRKFFQPKLLRPWPLEK